ncbi:MAG: iron-containing alcohol dehydrogenase [Clostridium sp.]|nr:iron-containing alcohol dehydrogenase [Clostridium sp.]
MMYNNEKFLNEFKDVICEINPNQVLFVCSSEYDRYGYKNALDEIEVHSVSFTAFEPCPEVSSVHNGVKVFKDNNCDFIVAVGGGSAIDVAKAIKLFAESDVKILAVPTTAGTGAEVTRFAVLYNNGDKESVRSWDIIPEYQIFDYTALESLPYIQRVVTGLDAFSHALEAYWSKDATDESREYSAEALRLFNEYYYRYLDDDKTTYEPMMKCSALAGRAINIAQTTAAHAFSYKLHKLKGFYHGQAVAICLVYIWKYMLENNMDDVELELLLAECEIVSGYTPEMLEQMLEKLGLLSDLSMTDKELAETVTGVNVGRLSNHPVSFTEDDIKNIYKSFIIIDNTKQ